MVGGRNNRMDGRSPPSPIHLERVKREKKKTKNEEGGESQERR